MKTIYECSQSTGVKWITVIFFLIMILGILVSIYEVSKGGNNIEAIIVTAILLVVSFSCFLVFPMYIIAEDEGLMQKAVKYLKKLSAKKHAMDETEYLMSSPAMADILRQGEEDIKNGLGRVIKLEDLWK